MKCKSAVKSPRAYCIRLVAVTMAIAIPYVDCCSVTTKYSNQNHNQLEIHQDALTESGDGQLGRITSARVAVS
jgi:hypothetical protein